MDPSRASLPITRPVHTPAAPADIRDAGPAPSLDVVRPPKGAPNVLIVLIDDMGFGASSPFGGPCRMPATQRLADNGLRFSRFTPPRCVPRRGRRCFPGAITIASAWEY